MECNRIKWNWFEVREAEKAKFEEQRALKCKVSLKGNLWAFLTTAGCIIYILSHWEFLILNKNSHCGWKVSPLCWKQACRHHRTVTLILSNACQMLLSLNGDPKMHLATTKLLFDRAVAADSFHSSSVVFWNGLICFWEVNVFNRKDCLPLLWRFGVCLLIHIHTMSTKGTLCEFASNVAFSPNSCTMSTTSSNPRTSSSSSEEKAARDMHACLSCSTVTLGWRSATLSLMSFLQMKEILQGGLEELLGCCNLKLGLRSTVGSDVALLSEEQEFARRSDQFFKPAAGLAQVAGNELRVLEFTFLCSESFFVKTDCMCSAIDVWRLQTENSTAFIITFFSPHLWNLRMLAPNSFIIFDISAVAYTISVFIATGMERGVIWNTINVANEILYVNGRRQQRWTL